MLITDENPVKMASMVSSYLLQWQITSNNKVIVVLI